jgi:hypothetical protein
VWEHPLEFPGLLPNFQPVEEEVGNFKPYFEPLSNLLLFTTLFRTQPGVSCHTPCTLFAFCDEFPRQAGADPVRKPAVLAIERINLLERSQCTIEITKLQKPFFAELVMVLNCRLDEGVLGFFVFHRCSRSTQDTGDIGKARFVLLVGAAAEFGFDRAKLPGAGTFQVMLLAISQDDSLVLVRVTPPRQNFSALPPFLPYFLCVSCVVPALSGARCRSAAACFRYRATLRWCSASVLANRWPPWLLLTK